jgi:hypothetical protein
LPALGGGLIFQDLYALPDENTMIDERMSAMEGVNEIFQNNIVKADPHLH